jgi:hypothetical protein
MSEDRKNNPEWLITAGAVAALSAVSPPAAGAAAIVLGMHQIYTWYQRQPDDDQGLDKD